MNKCLITLFSIFLIMTDYVFADTIRVITKENALREICRFYAPVKSSLKYGDILEVISTEGDWYKVKFKGILGCIHKSAIETKSVSTFQGLGSQKQGATEQEVALAGKGFNQEVEKAFNSKHPELKYNIVDAIDRYKVDEKRVFEFIKMGGLVQP
ncbi:MAG: SH3 domain-containing protein [Thermodesulfovibrionales bacterium]|nr:SH3 domain-containing protein [Thermodesulfovibrionales bacterium]